MMIAKEKPALGIRPSRLFYCRKNPAAFSNRRIFLKPYSMDFNDSVILILFSFPYMATLTSAEKTKVRPRASP